ncbi:MAG TPA: roadblock/LC7 domain-containing protein [Kineosporiaceae bacterium]|nr:roadblock/LC7 domain-containing protein [Kineosporiaceae bacterium]
MNEVFQPRLSEGARNVNWLLDNFVAQTEGVEQAVGVSADGLLMAISSPLDRADADRFAASLSGLISLALGTSRVLRKGPLRQVITEFGQGYLLVQSIGDGSCLGVVTSGQCDLGLVGYQSTLLVQRIGQLLSPELIAELKTNLLR